MALNYLLDVSFSSPGSRSQRIRFYRPLRNKSGRVPLVVLIHNSLADAGATEIALDRVDRELRSPRVPARILAVREAYRWLPAARAEELLRRAMADKDEYVHHSAQRALACAGNIDAWQRLLKSELNAPSKSSEDIQDAVRCLMEVTSDSGTRDSLIAVTKSILFPALKDLDATRSAKALELTRELATRMDRRRLAKRCPQNRPATASLDQCGGSGHRRWGT